MCDFCELLTGGETLLYPNRVPMYQNPSIPPSPQPYLVLRDTLCSEKHTIATTGCMTTHTSWGRSGGAVSACTRPGHCRHSNGQTSGASSGGRCRLQGPRMPVHHRSISVSIIEEVPG